MLNSSNFLFDIGIHKITWLITFFAHAQQKSNRIWYFIKKTGRCCVLRLDTKISKNGLKIYPEILQKRKDQCVSCTNNNVFNFNTWVTGEGNHPNGCRMILFWITGSFVTKSSFNVIKECFFNTLCHFNQTTANGYTSFH